MFHANTRDRNINKWKIGAPDSANRYFYCLLLWFQRFSKRPNEIVSCFCMPNGNRIMVFLFFKYASHRFNSRVFG